MLTEREFLDVPVGKLKNYSAIVIWVDDADIMYSSRNVCLTSGCYGRKIPLNWLTLKGKGAELSDIPDYQTVPIFAYILTCNSLLLP